MCYVGKPRNNEGVFYCRTNNIVCPKVIAYKNCFICLVVKNSDGSSSNIILIVLYPSNIFRIPWSKYHMLLTMMKWGQINEGTFTTGKRGIRKGI
jgi:hypothetical protein